MTADSPILLFPTCANCFKIVERTPAHISRTKGNFIFCNRDCMKKFAPVRGVAHTIVNGVKQNKFLFANKGQLKKYMEDNKRFEISVLMT